MLSLHYFCFYDKLRTLSLTRIAEGPTLTNSKHISRDPYSLLLCDITTHPQADRHAGNMSHDGHILLMCDITNPTPTARHMENTACSTVVGAYRVYRAVAWQHVDQIRHSIDQCIILMENVIEVLHNYIKCCHNAFNFSHIFHENVC
jgi:hypothetical protein